MAYVVIQHLDPTQKGMLPELLQRISKMKVYQATENLSVKPNCVYVIPPNKSMAISKGKLVLSDPLEIRGLRLPVDFFLRSLAEDCKELWCCYHTFRHGFRRYFRHTGHKGT